jgi:hypothetical protein
MRVPASLTLLRFRAGMRQPGSHAVALVAAPEPRRIVVELNREQFEALDKACGRVAPADYLRLVALRLASLSEQDDRTEPAYFSHLDRRELVPGPSAASSRRSASLRT